MYKLMQYLIAFKYSCKLNHWQSENFSTHLLYDRLTEDLDTWADKIAESYFMASEKQSILKSDLLNSKLIDKDIIKMCETIIQHLENLHTDSSLNEGIKSLLGDIESEFSTKLALARL